MSIPSFKYVILYVRDITISKSFYTELLGQSPKELSSTFLSFELESGLVLELWQLDKVHPAASFTGAGSELCIISLDNDSPLVFSYFQYFK
jgi:catechol-2,3-dioxygenase